MPTQQAVRRWILTGAVTAITVTGTLYGASLKSDQEVHQERKRASQATPEQMIAQLETTREDLVRRKTELERKITTFSARRRERDQENGQASKEAK